MKTKCIFSFALSFASFLWAGMAPSATGQTIARQIEAGPPVRLMLAVDPAGMTQAYAVEESLPANAVPLRISDNGIFDRHANKVKWGPFLDNEPRVLEAEIVGEAGGVSFAGAASFDGADALLPSGVSGAVLPDPESYFLGWQYLYIDGADKGRFVFPVSREPGAAYPLLLRYAFGLEPAKIAHLRMRTLPGGEMEFRFPIDTRRVDVDVFPEFSTDLVSWEPVQPREISTEATGQHTSDIVVPVSGEQPHGFFRVGTRF